MKLIDESCFEINGKRAPYSVFLVAEIIFRHRYVARNVVLDAIRDDRQRRGWSRIAKNENNALNLAVTRIRKLLAGSGYKIKGIYGAALQVIEPAEEKLAA